MLWKILYPEPCLICGNNSGPLCPACEQEIPFLWGKRCRHCGKMLISEQDLCLKCRNEQDETFLFNSHSSLFLYDELGKILIQQYKFKKETSLAPLFACWISRFIKTRYANRPVTLIPVPPRKNKLKQKGWDQVFLLMRYLNQDIPRAFLLEREPGKAQKELNRENRKNNLEGKFHLRKNATLSVSDILLLDDVFTTGATLNACAATLKKAGYTGRIDALTLAKD